MTNAALIAAGYDPESAWRGQRNQDGLSRYMGCSSLVQAKTLAAAPGDYFSMRTIQRSAQRTRQDTTTKDTHDDQPRPVLTPRLPESCGEEGMDPHHPEERRVPNNLPEPLA